jgi:hypothetical protein
MTLSTELRYLLMKRGLYYRPDECGYTGVKAEAGRYREADASPEHGVSAIHEDEAPVFAPACWDATKIAHLEAAIITLRKSEDELRADYVRLATSAKRVMDMLEEHGPSVVPHLIDTDDNPGQFLREDISQALSNTEDR